MLGKRRVHALYGICGSIIWCGQHIKLRIVLAMRFQGHLQTASGRRRARRFQAETRQIKHTNIRSLVSAGFFCAHFVLSCLASPRQSSSPLRVCFCVVCTSLRACDGFDRFFSRCFAPAAAAETSFVRSWALECLSCVWLAFFLRNAPSENMSPRDRVQRKHVCIVHIPIWAWTSARTPRKRDKESARAHERHVYNARPKDKGLSGLWFGV